MPESEVRWEGSFDEGWRFHLGDVSGAHAPSFEDRDWRELDVPHDWSIEDLPYATSDQGAATADPSAWAYRSFGNDAPRVIGPFDLVKSRGRWKTGYTVGGVGWYRKHFEVPTVAHGEGEAGPHAGEQRVELRFDGVYENADFWLNGQKLGFNPNGYVGFAFDITPYVRDGDNVLAVRVDNTGVNSRWYSGSGIYRHTSMTVTGPVRVPLWGVKVTTPVARPERSVVRVAVSVVNFGPSSTSPVVEVTVIDSSGHTIASQVSTAERLSSGSTGNYTVDLPVANATLWSPQAPNLYRARADVLLAGKLVDSVTTTFGIRSIEMSDKGFLLNGENTKMRGGCVHLDHGALGSVSLYASEERRVKTMKDLGYNAIRPSHSPPSVELLDACDRLGMLVVDEFSDMFQHQKSPDDYHQHFTDWWRHDLTNMIMRDQNHPSIVMWSLGNEICVADFFAGDSTGATSDEYCRELAALVRSIDETRPLTEGGDFFAIGRAETLDIGDIHYAEAPPQEGMPPPVVRTWSEALELYPGKAVISSESFASQVYDTWKVVQDNDQVIGDFVWTSWDYIGESGLGIPPLSDIGELGSGVPYPWFQGNCGDVDLIGQRKPQSYWRSVVWGLSALEMAVERPTPGGTEQLIDHARWNWGYYDELQSWTWDVPLGQHLKVRVYTYGEAVKLLLNGTEIATNLLTESNKRQTTFNVPYDAGKLTAIAYEAGQEIGRKTLQTTGAPAMLRLSTNTTELTVDRDELAHVLVEVLDARERVVPDATVPVSFAAFGAGALAGVANANPHNVDSFKRPHRHTYHGQALAVLRPSKEPGDLTLTVTSPGLKSASLKLSVSRRLERPAQ